MLIIISQYFLEEGVMKKSERVESDKEKKEKQAREGKPFWDKFA